MKYQIRCDVRSYMKNALLGYNKSSEVPYIDCTGSFFKKWIKFCFENGMTFKNRGDMWHIDHVIPIGSRDISKKDTQKIILRWFNTSPLVKEENMIKKAKLDLIQSIKHVGTLMAFCELNNIPLDDEYIKSIKKEMTQLFANMQDTLIREVP